ncbi:hypothetical protein D3C87_1717220 [compost metagenome]
MFHHHLLVDNGSDGGGQNVQDEARRIGLVDREGERVGRGRLGLLGNIVAGQPELGQKEGRRLVELDGAFEREGNVFGGQRVA